MEKETNWKYIVYCTTNILNNKIYVGVHKCKNPDIFDGYIGCGCYVNQPHTYAKPKTAFLFAVKKYGPGVFKRVTLGVFDTEIEASNMEEIIVDEEFIKRDDVYNMILGGLNLIGKTNAVKVFLYTLDGNYLTLHESYAAAGTALGIHWSGIYNAVKRKGSCAGFYWSTDQLDKLDINLYKKINPTKIPVYLYDKSGSYLSAFSSITECANYINISTSETCHAVYYGYLLRDAFYVCFTLASSYDVARKKYTKNRPVYKYNADGTLVESYNNQSSAELSNKNVNIDKFIKNKKADPNGYYWRLFKLANLNIPHKGPNSRKTVYKYNLLNLLVCTFKSKTEAGKIDGEGIWKIIDLPNKTYKKHIYTTLPIKDIV